MIHYKNNPKDRNLIKARVFYQTYTTEIITDEKGRIKFENIVSPSKKYVQGWIPESELEEVSWDFEDWISNNVEDLNHHAFYDVGQYPKIDILNYELLLSDGQWDSWEEE